MYKNFIKPCLDRSLALFLLVFLSPFFLLCAILIRFKMGSPIFFTQERPGLKGKIFKIYKFRTMSNETDANGKLLSDGERLRGVGKLIRKSSLDELPQLINVLKGEMSFVGPRPLLPEYLPLYSKHEARRHEVLPGITGLAQVNGRNAICWEEKFRLDVAYVDNLSFGLDLSILFLTFKKVLISEGVNAAGQVTTTAFQGSSKRAAIYGAGGHGLVVADIAESLGYDIVYVIDAQKKMLLGIPTISEEEFLQDSTIKTVFLGIGNNNIRADIFARFTEKGYLFPSLIHPKAIVSKRANIGFGSVVCAGCIVNANAVVGEAVILNSGCIIEHDNVIGSFAHISPHATLAGGVKIGEYTHIGASAVVREQISVGKNVIVGAGAVVVSCIEDYKRVVGNPAKREL